MSLRHSGVLVAPQLAHTWLVFWPLSSSVDSMSFSSMASTKFIFFLSLFRVTSILYIIEPDDNQNSASLSGSPWNNQNSKRTKRASEPTVLPFNVPSLGSILLLSFLFFLFLLALVGATVYVYVPLLIERHSVVISSANQRPVLGNTHLSICHRLSSCQVKDNESGHG